MHGEGHRQQCPECGQRVGHLDDLISTRELRGPRNITSTNIDRVFDDRGQRFLFIEEKNPWESFTRDDGEPTGQARMLRALSSHHHVWVVKGTPEHMDIWRVLPHGFQTLGSGDWDYYQGLVADWFDGHL